MVAYDGTEFHGWQRQPGRRTVQGVLEDALARFAGAPVTAQGAGRTDAGVHARGQVASFRLDTRAPARALAPALNPLLPRDVRVRDGAEVADDFDARRSARARHYRYRLLGVDDVLLARYAWHPRVPPPALDRLEAAVRPLEGEHDFTAFRATGGSEGTPVCRVTRAAWTTWEGGVQFDVAADHFLYHMVRSLVGTALAAAAGDDPAHAMRGVLASRDRARAGVTAPPHGLTLERVDYDRAAAEPGA